MHAADIAMPDGFGLLCALWLYGQSGVRLTGVEMAKEIIKLAAENKERVYLLGDDKGSAEKAAMVLQAEFHELEIVGAEAGPDFAMANDQLSMTNEKLIGRMNQAKPAVVLAAFGHPHQEKWLHENLSKMSSVKIVMGVGGTFDFWSGTIRRAPRIFRFLGLEWLWRLILEPKRWKRICNAVIVFPVAVIVERFSKH